MEFKIQSFTSDESQNPKEKQPANGEMAINIDNELQD